MGLWYEPVCYYVPRHPLQGEGATILQQGERLQHQCVLTHYTHPAVPTFELFLADIKSMLIFRVRGWSWGFAGDFRASPHWVPLYWLPGCRWHLRAGDVWRWPECPAGERGYEMRNMHREKGEAAKTGQKRRWKDAGDQHFGLTLQNL